MPENENIDEKIAILDLPSPNCAEEVVALFNDEELRELATDLLRAGLTACDSRTLINLANVITERVETADELSPGASHIADIQATREEMRQYGGISEEELRAFLCED